MVRDTGIFIPSMFTNHTLLADMCKTLQWRHNERNDVSNHRRLECLHNRLFSRSTKTSKLRVTGPCEGNSPGTGEFPAQRASNAENVSIDDVIMKDLFYPV